MVLEIYTIGAVCGWGWLFNSFWGIKVKSVNVVPKWKSLQDCSVDSVDSQKPVRQEHLSKLSDRN